MVEQAQNAGELSHKESARYIIDLFNRLILHHGLWYAETRHQMGSDRALDLLATASKKSLEIQLKHLGNLFGFSMDGGIPSFLLEMEPEKLAALKDRLAKNWLVNDGVWFQTVEFSEGMNEAKRCNDSCWAQFSPLEASCIKKFLELPDQPGLDGLKQALGFRIYESINSQSIINESSHSFIFQMNKCRVQVARKRKGLADYPCKSGGLVEYSYFARTIDSRIETECISCPPDEHPDDYFCAWKFSLPSE